MTKREIKFRFRTGKKMIYPLEFADIFIKGDGNIYCCLDLGVDISSIHDTFVQTNDFIPMQYTGVKDKNGMEIFEGDIVKKDNDWDGVLRVVGYSKYEYVLHEKEQLKSGKRQDGSTFDFSSVIGSEKVYCEVVGNIYSNPDLLS